MEMEKLTEEELLRKLKDYSMAYPEELDADTLRSAGLVTGVMLLPSEFKERVQYLGNLFAQMCFKLQPGDARLKMELVTLATTLSYLLNSTSFIKGEYKDFDRAEIDRKLRRQVDEDDDPNFGGDDAKE